MYVSQKNYVFCARNQTLFIFIYCVVYVLTLYAMGTTRGALKSRRRCRGELNETDASEASRCDRLWSAGTWSRRGGRDFRESRAGEKNRWQASRLRRRRRLHYDDYTNIIIRILRLILYIHIYLFLLSLFIILYYTVAEIIDVY